MYKFIPIGLSELRVSKNLDDVFVVYGLGSCIAVCLYDKIFKIGGIAHIVLPNSNIDIKNNYPPAKFADTGIIYLLEEMIKNGAVKYHLSVKIFGGAAVFKSQDLDIGKRNIIAVKQKLKEVGLNNVFEDVGGYYPRTVEFFIDSGKIIVKNGKIIKEY